MTYQLGNKHLEHNSKDIFMQLKSNSFAFWLESNLLWNWKNFTDFLFNSFK